MAGCPLPNCRSPIADHQMPLPIADYRLPIIDPITDCRSSIANYRLPIIDCQLPIADHRLPITDGSAITDCRFQIAD
jgi:hypothetical protein